MLVVPGFYFLLFRRLALAASDEPRRLREAESLLANVLVALWALSIPYFIFVIISIGAQWMVSAGDENKLAVIKKRGGNVFLSFALVFGGYLVVRLVMSLVIFRDPNTCFDAAGSLENSPFFQFFFPNACG